MADEYNSQDVSEYGDLPEHEYHFYTDNPPQKDNAQHSGTNATPGETNEKVNANKKAGKYKKYVASFFASAAAITLLGSMTILPSASVNAEIVQTWVSDTEVGYSITITDTTKPLKVVLYNDFTRREADLETGENEGTFVGLKPNMNYTVAIEGNFGFGNTKVIKQSVRTEKTKGV